LQVLAGQDQEGLALGEPGRPSPHRVVQDPGQALRRDGLVGELPDHVPAPYDLGKVHRPAFRQAFAARPARCRSRQNSRLSKATPAAPATTGTKRLSSTGPTSLTRLSESSCTGALTAAAGLTLAGDAALAPAAAPPLPFPARASAVVAG